MPFTLFLHKFAVLITTVSVLYLSSTQEARQPTEVQTTSDSNTWAVVKYVGDEEQILAYFSSFDRASTACSKLCNTIPKTAFGFFDAGSQPTEAQNV